MADYAQTCDRNILHARLATFAAVGAGGLEPQRGRISGLRDVARTWREPFISALEVEEALFRHADGAAAEAFTPGRHGSTFGGNPLVTRTACTVLDIMRAEDLAARAAGSYFSARSVGHLGFTGTSFWLDLETGQMVVLLTNRVHLGRDDKTRIAAFRPRFQFLGLLQGGHVGQRREGGDQ